MPNRRGRAFNYRPNRNPHNPNERMVRPNGKHYYPRSAIRSVLYHNTTNRNYPGDDKWYVVVFQTQDAETARRIVELQLPGIRVSNPRPGWVKEIDLKAINLYRLNLDRPVDGKAAVIFDAESPDEAL